MTPRPARAPAREGARAGAPVRLPPAVTPLLARLGQLGDARGVAVYGVGGCVRDWLLGRSRLTDLDVTVEGEGPAFAQAAAKAMGGTLQVHPAFGTATLQLPGRNPRRRIDVAGCRKETYVRPAAYPVVARGTLEEDLFRRDFTLNAMAVALNAARFGALADPFRGREDLQRGRLRVLHARSFLDDPTRILRGIRFAQRFGWAFEAQTARRLREALAAGALGWLNAGRLERELTRLLQEPDPAACLRHLSRLLERAR